VDISQLPDEMQRDSAKVQFDNNKKSKNPEPFVDIEFDEIPNTAPYTKEKLNKKNIRAKQNKQNLQNIRKIFLKMHGLRKYEKVYGSYTPAIELFVLQAKYMVDFTDDYDTVVPFETFYPRYEYMNDQQLRTYFTWRAKVRQGQIDDTSLSYVLCYIYELINNIGALNAKEVIDKLFEIWEGFRVYNTKIDLYLAAWIKDYYVVNSPEYTFDSIISRFPVPYKEDSKLFQKLEHSIWDIELVEMNSQHKITGMAFYKKGNQKVIEGCLNAVFNALAKLFVEKKLDLVNLYVYLSIEYYEPFGWGLYKPEQHPNTTVKLSDYEVYTYEDGYWSLQKYRHTDFNITKGYILKTIEIEMRKAFGSKQSLTEPKTKNINKELREGYRSWENVGSWSKKVSALLKSKEFEQTIKTAIYDYQKTANIIVEKGIVTERKPIEIDLSKLDKIQKDHETTAQKLITEDILKDSLKDGFKKPPIIAPQKQTTTTVAPGFTGLAASLNNDEAQILVALLNKQQISQNSELLIESINEKAQTSIGDIVINTTGESLCIYEEYEGELLSVL